MLRKPSNILGLRFHFFRCYISKIVWNFQATRALNRFSDLVDNGCFLESEFPSDFQRKSSRQRWSVCFITFYKWSSIQNLFYSPLFFARMSDNFGKRWPIYFALILSDHTLILTFIYSRFYWTNDVLAKANSRANLGKLFEKYQRMYWVLPWIAFFLFFLRIKLDGKSCWDPIPRL